MRKLKGTEAGGFVVGHLPRGCDLCLRGAKLVLFLTGLCKKECFYCPLSEKRRQKDVVYANERPVRSWRDILVEAEEMDALGTGITGGDPMLRFRRMLKYAKLLKKKFGEEHHIHVYLCDDVSREKLKRMKEAGIDEVRFHLLTSEPVAKAMEVGLDAGIEIPAIPGWEERIANLMRELDEVEGAFINLNELEFSETNAANLHRLGFRLREDSAVAADGSRECALSVAKWGAKNTSLTIHYCSSLVKDSVQLRKRLIRKAFHVAKPHEEVNEDGLLFKGIVTGLEVSELARVRRYLIRKYRLKGDEVYLNREKKRIEVHWKLAEKLAKLEKNLKFALVEEYPTQDRLETTLIPL